MPESADVAEQFLVAGPYLEGLALLAGLCALGLLPAGSPRLGARTEWLGVLAGGAILAHLIARIAFLTAGPNLGPWAAVASIPIVAAALAALSGPRAMAPRGPLPASDRPSGGQRFVLWGGYLIAVLTAGLIVWLEEQAPLPLAAVQLLVVPTALVFAARVGGASTTTQLAVAMVGLSFAATTTHFATVVALTRLYGLGLDPGLLPFQLFDLAVSLSTTAAFAYAFRRLADWRCLALAFASVPWAVQRAYFESTATGLTGLVLIAAIVGWTPAPARRTATKFAAGAAAFLALLWVQG